MKTVFHALPFGQLTDIKRNLSGKKPPMNISKLQFFRRQLEI